VDLAAFTPMHEQERIQWMPKPSQADELQRAVAMSRQMMESATTTD
jgi:hypothetical protein